MIDLLVIGAGLSGLCAALKATEAGLRVRVVAKGLGAHHWGAGTVDLLGYAPGDAYAVPNPFAAFARLAPQHPYNLLGAERVRAALRDFQRLALACGLPYAGAPDLGHNILLPSPVGAVRPVFLAPEAQRKGDVQEGGPMLIVGFEGYRDFYPHLIAENLNKQGVVARAAFLPWETLTDQIDRNNAHLATGLDEPGRARRLGHALKPLAQPGERIGLPALLGMARHAEVVAELEAVTGAPVFEIPTLPPSIPGMRLYQALRARLFAAGTRVETNMEVIGFQAQQPAHDEEPGRVEWVETESSARPLRHRAQQFVLATGGVLGGGFHSDHTGRFWETIFDLPLTVPQERRAWFRPQFLDPQGQPVFRGGVRVDERLQPLRADGAPVYANVWAVGGALAEADPILERSLEGIAIATGIAAAERIVGERVALGIG